MFLGKSVKLFSTIRFLFSQLQHNLKYHSKHTNNYKKNNNDMYQLFLYTYYKTNKLAI